MQPDTISLQQVDQRDLLQSAFGAVAVIAGAFVVYNVGAAAVVVAFGVENLETLQAQPFLYALLNGVASAGFVVAAVGYLALSDQWDLLHVRKPTLLDLVYVLAGFVLVGAASVILVMVVSVVIATLESLFGITVEFGQNAVITTGRENPTAFLYMIPVALFVVGPGEELVFRGVVQGLFRRVIGVWPAIIVASVLFGLGHYFAISSGNAWTYLFVAGAMGLVLGAIYEHTENIVVPAAIHGVWNAFLFVVNWALVTFDVPMPA